MSFKHPKWRHTLQNTTDFLQRRYRALFFTLCVLAFVGLFISLTLFKTFRWRNHFSPDHRRTFQNIKTAGGHLGKENHIVYERYYDVTGSSVNRTENKTEFLTKEQAKSIDWNDQRLDILHMVKPEFDPRFQNPCWYEILDSPYPYDNNTFAEYSSAARNTLELLTDRWEDLFDQVYESVDDAPVVRRLRCLPYFLIIGQPKCGSSDLFWKVTKHPDIDTPPIKELHWWSRNRQGRRFNYTKIIPYEDYVDMFDRAGMRIEQRVANASEKHAKDQNLQNPHQIITGEASVSLFWDNNDWMKFPENGNQSEPLYIVPHYIHHMIPGVKLVLILREPTERMYSDYLYFNFVKKSAEDFHAVVKAAIDGFQTCFTQFTVRSCVYNSTLYNSVKLRLHIGLYSVFLADWLKVFPREQFFIARLEDYSKKPVTTIKQIYKFFGLREITDKEESALLQIPKSNVRKSSDRQIGGMLPETRALLNEFYRPFNHQLAQMLQEDKFKWQDVT